MLSRLVLINFGRPRLVWEYCFIQTNNDKRFKILKFIYIYSDIIFTCLQFSRRCITPHFWILLAFIWGQRSLVLVTFSWFFHKFNKRCMFTCYKSSCSDNLLTQSCLLIPVSHLVFRYLQHSPPIESSMIKYYLFRGSSISSFAIQLSLFVQSQKHFFLAGILQHSRSLLVPRLMV